jgi:hypothetical protein
MTSLRQFEANRKNALRSTGPRTEEGKSVSRRNAVRHGLAAETVIKGLEDSEDYRGFEAAIVADYDARTAVERELVLRLASLLWRLRRIISIETDLLQIQAGIRRARLDEIERSREPHAINGVPTRRSEDCLEDQARPWPDVEERHHLDYGPGSISAREITFCFLRLGNLDDGAFDRLGRYNTTLWKQTAQTLLLLQSIRHRVSVASS